MSFSAAVLTVLIASPGDTRRSRDTVEQAIRTWNSDRARDRHVLLLPLRWETDSVAQLGNHDAQSVINKQLVDDADIVIGLFHSRLGNRTKRAESGTAEEIARSIDRGVPTHVYFSDAPLPPDVDVHQLEAVRAFRNELGSKGLLGSYSSDEDLATKIRKALEYDVVALIGADGQVPGAGHAVLRAIYLHERDPQAAMRDRSSVRGRRERVEITNAGAGTAENVKIRIDAQGTGSPPIRRAPHPPSVRIPPGSRASFPVFSTPDTAVHWQVTISWEDRDGPHVVRQVVSAQ